MVKPVVQSLWVGNKLSIMEIYSIKSYLRLGYDFHLYTYEPVKNVPKGTKIKDGSKILSKKEIFKLKETYLPFADIFRYKMLYENGGYWTDLDMIAIKRFDKAFKDKPYVFSSERTIQKGAYKRVEKYIPNIGILKAPAKSPFYKELFEVCMIHQKKGVNKDKLKYMKIMRKMIEKYRFQKYVHSPADFCHLDWWYAKDAFLPLEKYRDKYGVKAKSISSMFSLPYTVLFWRVLVTKKYGLDLNGKYDDNSLWEKMKTMVDSKV